MSRVLARYAGSALLAAMAIGFKLSGFHWAFAGFAGAVAVLVATNEAIQ